MLIEYVRSHKKLALAVPVVLIGLVTGMYQYKNASSAVASLSHKSQEEAFTQAIGTEITFTFSPVRYKEFSQGTSLSGKQWDFGGTKDQDVQVVWVPKGTQGYDLAKSSQMLVIKGVVKDYKGKKEIVASSLEAKK